VIDNSPNGNTGTFVGAPAWTTGKIGGALSFNGSSYVTFPSSSSLAVNGSAISFGAWYYHTTSSDGSLLGKTASDYTYILGVNRGAQQFTFTLQAGGKRILGGFPASVPNGLSSYNNTWVHLFVTYDGTRIRAYVNGVERYNAAASGAVKSNGDPFAIGARGDGNEKFNGKIDEVRIYSRALSAAEVQQVYDLGTTPAPQAPVISSFTASPASVTAGGSSTLAWTVSNATSLSINQSVGTVTGLSSKVVTPSATTTYTLTASNGTGSATAQATVTVTAPPVTVTLSSLACSPTTLVTPATASCTATLSGAAPSGGAAVALSDSSTSLTTPSSVTVPAGSTSAGFTVNASSVTAAASATVTGSYGVSKSVSLNLQPAAVPTLSSVQCNPVTIPSAGTTSCSVTLTATAPSGGLNVSLSDNSSSLTVPVSANVPAGSTTAAFTAAASSVSSDQSAVVTAALNGVSKTVSLSITVSATANGLAGWWKLDETAGAAASDASGNGNQGTALNNPVWTSGIAIGSAQFNGTNYVRIPHSTSLAIAGKAISFGAWFYHTSTTNGYVMGKTVSQYTYMLGVSKGAQQFLVDLTTNGVRRSLGFPASVPNGLSKYNNTWVHLFVTYDGATIRAYVNGVQAASIAATGDIRSNLDDLAIGARGGDGSWTRFNTKIDDVRVYSRALSAAEVQALYSNPGQP
jgi:hypothetical protein